jgi:ribosomal protein S8
LSNVLISINNEQEAKLKAARQETVELREKINNHLIAEGFYNKPAKEVLPIMKEFGIQL